MQSTTKKRQSRRQPPGITPLTAPERETVILMSDADDVALITTYQRRILTKLERNPAARKIEDLRHGGQPGARFELAAAFISFRSRRRTNPGAGQNATFGRTNPNPPEASSRGA